MTTRLWGGAAVATLVCVATVTPARAQVSEETKKKAREYYDRGQTAYNLGRFDEAITEFSKGFEIYPEPVFLYNIAQSHRQKGEWERAKFFYKRYLSLAPTANNRAEVEKRIAEMDDEIAKGRGPVKPPPPDAEPTDQPTVTPPDDPTTPVPDDVPTSVPSTSGDIGIMSTVVRPNPIWLQAGAGPAFVSFGGTPSVPMQVSVAVGGGYLFTDGKLGLGVGVAGEFTNIPWRRDEDAEGTASFFGVGLGGRLLYAVGQKLDLRFELGGTVTWWLGLDDEKNPFIQSPAQAADGPVPMYGGRAAIGVDYHVTREVTLAVTPFAFTAIAKPDNLNEDIDGISKIDILFGIAYSL